MKMKFIDLERQFNTISEKIQAAINHVLKTGDFINGGAVPELEKQLAAFVGVKHCIAVANGTDALEISQRAIGISHDDEVLIPSFTWVSTAETIAYLGAKPVFCDVLKDSFTIDIEDCKRKLTSKTKALVAVSIFGQCADLFTLKEFCDQNNLILIEDAAQSFGASHHDPKNQRTYRSCSIADISTTSFFPSKPLGCYGDGGAIFTNDDDNAVLMRLLARHGQKSKDEFIVVGRNSRLDTIQAAILLEKLKIFNDELVLREKCADLYSQYLNHDLVKVPLVSNNNSSVFAIYTIGVHASQRNLLGNHLASLDIPYAIYYSKPLYKQNIYTNDPTESLPITDYLALTTISLPMHPYLEETEIQFISEEINKFLGG